MNCLSNIIGRQIINVKIAQDVGTVYNVRMDKKLSRIKSLEILVEAETGDFTCILPVGLFKYTPYEVMLLSTPKQEMIRMTEDSLETVGSPIGKKCFDTYGQYIGRIKDVIFCERLYTESIVIDELVYTSKDVVFASNELIIVKGKRPNLPRYLQETAEKRLRVKAENVTNIDSSIFDNQKKEEYSTTNNYDVELVEYNYKNIQKTTQNYEQENQNEQEENKSHILTVRATIHTDEVKENDDNKNIDEINADATNDNGLVIHEERDANIAKVVGGKESLIGRKLQTNVLAYNNLVLGLAGSFVTTEMLEQCAKNGKLIDLIKSTTNK